LFAGYRSENNSVGPIENNLVENLKNNVDSDATKNVDILATSLSVLHNCFDSSTKLFFCIQLKF